MVLPSSHYTCTYPMQWYYAIDGVRHGPVPTEELVRLVQAGTIRADTLVWRSGMPEWLPYGQVAASSVTTGAAMPANMTEAAIEPAAVGAPLDGPSVTIAGYGGFWRRLLAKIIDGIITGVASWIILLPLMMLSPVGAQFTGTNPEFDPEQIGALLMFQLISFLIQVAIPLGYGLFFISKFDATPGKMALGLKLYRADGSKLSKGRIIGRFFAEWLSWLTLGIGYVIAAFDSEKRTLHDHVADTRVVRVP